METQRSAMGVIPRELDIFVVVVVWGLPPTPIQKIEPSQLNASRELYH